MHYNKTRTNRLQMSYNRFTSRPYIALEKVNGKVETRRSYESVGYDCHAVSRLEPRRTKTSPELKLIVEM